MKAQGRLSSSTVIASGSGGGTHRPTLGQTEYLAKRDGLPILSRGQVRRLIGRVRSGDEGEAERAKRKLIEHNTFLVWKAARKYYSLRQNHTMTLEDLFQEGSMGLLKAIEKFEPEKGNAFSTYAMWWINQRITRAYDDADLTIRIPVHMREGIRRYYRIRKEMMDAQDDPHWEPTLDEVFERVLKTHPKTTLQLKPLLKRGHALGTSSLDQQTAATEREGGHSTLGDFVADEKQEAEIQMEHMPYGQEAIVEVLSCLPPRQERMVRLKYGLMAPDDEPRTLDEVGKIESLTRERVRQIVLDAMLNMRRQFSRRGYIVDGHLPRYTHRADRAVERAGDAPESLDYLVILNRRRERSVTRQTLSKICKMPEKMIGRIECGALIPSYEDLENICKVLGLSMESLVAPEEIAS